MYSLRSPFSSPQLNNHLSALINSLLYQIKQVSVKQTLAKPPESSRHWGQLHGSATALAIAEHASRIKQLCVVLVPGMTELTQLEAGLQFFLPENRPLLVVPDWETLPYDPFSPHSDIVSQRIEALYHLPKTKRGVLLLPVSTLMQRLAPPAHMNQFSLVAETGQTLDPDLLREDLSKAGYRAVDQVLEPGEYARRGSILDIYPMGSKAPYRLDFFDDELDSIRSFEVETQIAKDKVESVHLLPAQEFPFNESGITTFRQNFRDRFENYSNCPMYRDVSNGLLASGIEYYQQLFFDQPLVPLNEYLPAKTSVLALDGCSEAITAHWENIGLRYEQMRYDVERPLLPPEEVFLSDEQALKTLADMAPIHLHSFETTEDKAYNFGSQLPGSYGINARNERPLMLLEQYLDKFDGRVLFTAESPGRRESLLGLLRDNRHTVHPVEDWQDFLGSKHKLAITVAPVASGLQCPSAPVAIVDETQMLGQRARKSNRKRRDARKAEALISNLADLQIGAPVVHIDNGVGRYQGLTTLDVGGTKTEFLTLLYASDAKLYVPVASLHLISRYSGSDEDSAPLHKLGSEQWAKVKRKAAEKARDVAVELLDIHARRAARKGRSFELDVSNYETFSAAFPFEETEDQGRAIEDVVADLRSEQPTDRVVCGDVGFGKTEVAMRAAFVAADGGAQVAVLVPTTLLAQQHLKNFQDRFADWPFKIAGLSRFGGKANQTNTLKGLADGSVDIVIGTHKILSKDVKFKNLGLVIIDEEHRFGVRHKEALKSLRAEVDLLTLTATPIPRTLNMSLAGMRDMSIIATAPAHRHAIKTFVCEWNDQVIREAVQRELSRGGQVYVLHNRVDTIAKVTRDLEELLPEATVRFAHGQMAESELEEVMLDFYHQRFNVLVCTTIVESGIDVSTANTIIIDRADKLGLAQLHQLRGRVGRSHHRAYAYLLAPPKGQLTPDAEKRLAAIESLEELGVGFTLATHDLEIRGAGELLGEGQSGQIQAIGFSLYTELLERAVKALKSGQIPEVDAPLMDTTEVDLHMPALLPEDYVPDVHMRLVLYKRIASAADLEALHDIQVELINRFGLLPDQGKNLIAVTELKLRCEALGVKKLDFNAAGGRVLFTEKPKVDLMVLIELVQKQSKTYKFEGQSALRISADLRDRETRLAAAEALLKQLEA